MPRFTAGVLAAVLAVTACSYEPIEDPELGAGDLTSTVYAVDGTVIAKWHADQDRVPVSYAEIPIHVFDAGVIVQGGSTITQQYIKNVLVGGEVSLERKVEEATMALRLEESLTKTEILERYLNTVFFGEGSYGIGAAAKRYFGVEVGALDLPQAALLASLIQSPTVLNPYVAAEKALLRREVVLASMVELGWIDPHAADVASVAPLSMRPRGEHDRIAYPYFVDEVKARLLADPALGATFEKRYDLLFRRGVHIHTTLDPRVQDAATAAIASVVPIDGPSIALVAIEPGSGHVVAMVGGRDYYHPEDPVGQFNLATQGRRQPGSAFKPFTLAAALQSGIGLDDEFAGGRTVSIATPAGTWEVNNHQLAAFPDLALREATVFSVNVVYARVIDMIGPDRVAAVAAVAGITTPLEPYHSLALGTQEVSVLDMASAYGTFANGGIHTDPVLITRIEDRSGQPIWTPVHNHHLAMEPEIAAEITAALNETVLRGTGMQAKIGRPVAGKTGTSEGNHDAWFVGYTPELSAAVWVGFPEGNRPLVRPHTPYTVTGGTWPAQVWSRFAIAALPGIAYGELPTATGANESVTVDIDLSTGFLAGPLCPRRHLATVHVSPGAVPTAICPIHNPAGLQTIAVGITPAVERLALGEAVQLLEAASLRTRLTWTPGGEAAAATVIGQVPDPMTEIGFGATVSLTVVGQSRARWSPVCSEGLIWEWLPISQPWACRYP